MKKIYLLVAVALMLSANFVYAEPAEIRCDSISSLVGTLAAGTTDTESPVLQLVRKTGYAGYFSVQAVFTGTGVLKISYQVSNDNVNWSTAVQIVAAAVTKVVYPYPAAGVNIFAGYQRLVFEETGSANPVVITVVTRCTQ